MRADEVTAIAWSEAFQGDALLLWRFGEEYERLSSRHYVAAVDISDTYAVWRNSHLRVPEDPSGKPTTVIIPYGSARDLRELAHRQLNFHGEPGAEAGSTVLVMNMDTELPGVYVAAGDPTRYVAVFGSIRLWVSRAEGSSSYPAYLLSRALGYWFTLLVRRNPFARKLTSAPYVCSATVRASAGSFAPHGARASRSPFYVTSDWDGVIVVIDDSFWEHLGASRNALEVELIGALMFEVLTWSGSDDDDAERCVDALRAIAQASPQSRMLQSYDTGSLPGLIHKVTAA